MPTVCRSGIILRLWLPNYATQIGSIGQIAARLSSRKSRRDDNKGQSIEAQSCSALRFKHHVCTIAQKRENYLDGKDYWELHAVFEKSLKLFIACDAAKSPAMRPVMQKQEAIDLIDSIADAKPVNLEDDAAATAKTSSLQQRQIKEVYESYLKTLSPKDLVPIIKTCHERTIARKECGHQATAVDKKYLDLAEGLLCDELSISLEIPRDQVKDFLVMRIRQVEAASNAE